ISSRPIGIAGPAAISTAGAIAALTAITAMAGTGMGIPITATGTTTMGITTTTSSTRTSTTTGTMAAMVMAATTTEALLCEMAKADHTALAISRSLNFWILPVEVLGSSTNTTWRGHL